MVVVRTRVVGLTLVALVAVAACGGDGPAATPTSSAGAGTTRHGAGGRARLRRRLSRPRSRRRRALWSARPVASRSDWIDRSATAVRRPRASSSSPAGSRSVLTAASTSPTPTATSCGGSGPMASSRASPACPRRDLGRQRRGARHARRVPRRRGRRSRRDGVRVGDGRIRKITPDGTITTVAGVEGEESFEPGGDGVPAVGEPLGGAGGAALAPDGSSWSASRWARSAG